MTGRILIAEDISTHRIVLKARLTDAAYDASTAASRTQLLDAAYKDKPDIVLLSDPFGDQQSVSMIRALRAIPGMVNVPVILLCDDTSRAGRLRAIHAGADAVLARLPDMPVLRARLRNLLRRSASDDDLPEADAMGLSEAAATFQGQVGQIAVVAPTLAEGLDWRNGLSDKLRDRITVLDPMRTLSDLAALPHPDAVVIGATDAQDDRSIDLLADLRSRAETRHAALLLTATERNEERMISALDLGANDVLEGAFDAEEMACILRREIGRKVRDDRRREERQTRLKLAHTDPLTGLHNRRSALRHLTAVAQRAEEQRKSFAVMVLDLDRFKSVNDRFGHAAGDTVLVALAERMQDCLRHGDFLGRIGGEEFVAIVRNCDLTSAQIAAERLRAAVASAPVPLPGSSGAIEMTVSIGLVIGGSGGATGSAAELIDLADRGLYAAKSDGRNQVTLYQSAA